MGVFDWFKNRKKSPRSNQGEAAPPAMITVFDERGRELKVERAVWGKDVLLPNIEKAWNEPDALYAQIVQALQDQFADLVVDAAERLVEIDHESERALVVLAIVRMKNGNLVAAEKTIAQCITKHGRTGMVLTNLAKVQAEWGDHEKSMATLREALRLDPNQDNALLWWAAISHEKGGEAAYVAALNDIASEPGAWRPKLWIARERLKQGDRDGALTLYRAVLSVAADQHDVLMMVSGDLGNAGALDELVRLVAPRYQPERHGPHTGFNIARALKELGRTGEAHEMVRRLQALALPPFAESLAKLEREIVDATLPQAASEPPEVIAVPISGLLWTRGFYDPSWLIPALPEDAPEVAFVVLADETVSADSEQIQKTNDSGRLTRAIPLYLAEVLRLGHGVHTACTIFVAKGHGPVVFGAPHDVDSLSKVLAPRLGNQAVVFGSLTVGGVRVSVADLKTGEVFSTFTVSDDVKALGPLSARLEEKIVAVLRDRGWLPAAVLPGFYRRPPEDLLTPYVSAIEQLLYQVLAANGFVPAESLWNERGFFESYFGLVEAWPRAPDNARLIAACGVAAGVQYKSSILDPYRKIVLRWLDEAPSGGVLDQLSPALLKRLGEPDRLRAALDRPSPIVGDAYADWLRRVQAD